MGIEPTRKALPELKKSSASGASVKLKPCFPRQRMNSTASARASAAGVASHYLPGSLTTLPNREFIRPEATILSTATPS